MKNKRKKGFTLIELLAVIVILAIIMIIAIPKILNVIENSRKLAFEDSANLMAKDATLAYSTATLTGDANSIVGSYQFQNGDYAENSKKLSFKGDKPYSGVIVVNDKGKVAMAIQSNDGGKAGKWCALKYYTNKNVVVKAYNKDTCKLPTSPDDPESNGKVYKLGDPIDYNVTTGKECGEPNKSTGTKSGCMRFYVIDKNDTVSRNIVNVILDHNTTDLTAWGTTETGEIANSTLSQDTLGWVVSSGTTPRLISINELSDITGVALDTSGFQTELKFKAKYGWIINNSYSCEGSGCGYTDTSSSTGILNNGYWTNDKSNDNASSAWAVYSDSFGGKLDYNTSSSFGRRYGVRPVITIDKSNLNYVITGNTSSSGSNMKVYSKGTKIYYNIDTGRGCSQSEFELDNPYYNYDSNTRNVLPHGCNIFYSINTNDTSSNRLLDVILDHGIRERNTYYVSKNDVQDLSKNWKVAAKYGKHNARLLTFDELKSITDNNASNIYTDENSWLISNLNNMFFDSYYWIEADDSNDEYYVVSKNSSTTYTKQSFAAALTAETRPVIKIDKTVLSD